MAYFKYIIVAFLFNEFMLCLFYLRDKNTVIPNNWTVGNYPVYLLTDMFTMRVWVESSGL